METDLASTLRRCQLHCSQTMRWNQQDTAVVEDTSGGFLSHRSTPVIIHFWFSQQKPSSYWDTPISGNLQVRKRQQLHLWFVPIQCLEWLELYTQVLIMVTAHGPCSGAPGKIWMCFLFLLGHRKCSPTTIASQELSPEWSSKRDVWPIDHVLTSFYVII